jgi:hypothetical protein
VSHIRMTGFSTMNLLVLALMGKSAPPRRSQSMAAARGSSHRSMPVLGEALHTRAAYGRSTMRVLLARRFDCWERSAQLLAKRPPLILRFAGAQP